MAQPKATSHLQTVPELDQVIAQSVPVGLPNGHTYICAPTAPPLLSGGSLLTLNAAAPTPPVVTHAGGQGTSTIR
jgi:hypothetical protein